jgi:transcription initiation factor TFIID subunit 2
MRVCSQKNIYYVDLNKNIFRGYIETKLIRDIKELNITYRSTHLKIESVAIIDETFQLFPEFCIAKEDSMLDNNQQDLHRSSKSNPILEEASLSYRNAFKISIPEAFQKTEFTVRICYSPLPENPNVMWYKQIDEKDKHKEIVALNLHNDSSFITPYIDSVTDLELIYIIPNTEEVKVVSSGHFRAIKEEDKTIIYSYGIVTHPKYLMFGIGTYGQTDIYTDNDKRRILSPVSIETDLTEVINDLQFTIKYIENFLKTDEMHTINVIFTLIDIHVAIGTNIAVIGYNNLGNSRDIESCFILKRILTDCLSHQVFGFLNFGILDFWICTGLQGYLSDYCIRYLLGNNEFLYNLKEDKDYVVKNDVLEPPLFYTLRKEIDYYSDFFKRKSKMVFHCMEAHLSTAFLQKIAEEILDIKKNRRESEFFSHKEDLAKSPKMPAIQSEIACKCFTSRFIKIVKDVTGKDLKTFFDFYVFKPGLLKIKLGVQISKKKNMVKIIASQTPTSLLQGCNRKYTNNISLKSVEIEGTFDHTVTIDGDNTFFYHTRTKKKKKEEEDETMPLLFIRVDPKRECLFDFILEQPDYMYMEQLLEKSVIGQLEAVNSLKNKATVNTCEALERVLDNSHVFYKVRIKITYILRNINIEEYNGLQRLIQYFVRTRCVPNSTIIKGNEFGLVQYFIQKHLIKSISSIHNSTLEDSKTITAFLENILRFNDNSLSSFDDSWYLATVINNLSIQSILCSELQSANSLKKNNKSEIYSKDLFDYPIVESSESIPVLHENNLINEGSRVDCKIIQSCLNEIERFRILDMVFPSNNNIISRSCLISLIRMAYYKKVQLNRPSLEYLALYPNLSSIRLVAIEGLFVLFEDATEYVFSSILADSPHFVQSVLEIILRILKSDIFFCKNLNFSNIHIVDLISDIFVFIQNKQISQREFVEKSVKSFNLSREEANRNSLLKITTTMRRLKLNKFDELRCKLIETDHILRIPRYKNAKVKVLIKEPAPKFNLKIRLKYAKFVPKHTGLYIFRFKMVEQKIDYKRADIPILLLKKFKEHHSSAYLDEFIRKTKPTDFFEWVPLTFKKITDIVKGGADLQTTYSCLEKSLIFVLSYTNFNGKMYFAAKVMFNLIERCVFQHAFIQAKVSPMTEYLRIRARELIELLLNNKRFEGFVHPVDFSELKSYLDIVRIPVCLSDINSKINDYRGFDAFIYDLERIYTNCLNFNNKDSEIAKAARELKTVIDEFKNGIALEYKHSYDVLEEIVKSVSNDQHFAELYAGIRNMKSWGDIDNELAAIKKKYSRYSVNGRICSNGVKYIRNLISLWFSVDNGKISTIKN